MKKINLRSTIEEKHRLITQKAYIQNLNSQKLSFKKSPVKFMVQNSTYQPSENQFDSQIKKQFPSPCHKLPKNYLKQYGSQNGRFRQPLKKKNNPLRRTLNIQSFNLPLLQNTILSDKSDLFLRKTINPKLNDEKQIFQTSSTVRTNTSKNANKNRNISNKFLTEPDGSFIDQDLTSSMKYDTFSIMVQTDDMFQEIQRLKDMRRKRISTEQTKEQPNLKIKINTPKINNKKQIDNFSIRNIKSPQKNFNDLVLKKQRKHVKNIITNNVKIQDFYLCKCLGQGRFGLVFEAIHKQTGFLVAIKKVPKQMIKNHLMIDQFILEIKLQSAMHHAKIIELYDVFDDSDHIYLILEYMQGGTLYSVLKKFKSLPQREVAIQVKDICQAVSHIHENSIAHRDIKPENIVITNGVCKLGDFGWATFCNERRTTYCGTFDYAAPQILEGIQYDMSVDLWCLGILTYELLAGKAPFFHVSRQETKKRILKANSKQIKFTTQFSKESIDFIRKLIQKQPELRMKSQQALKHKFLNLL